jgi:hypothetical protein
VETVLEAHPLRRRAIARWLVLGSGYKIVVEGIFIRYMPSSVHCSGGNYTTQFGIPSLNQRLGSLSSSHSAMIYASLELLLLK